MRRLALLMVFSAALVACRGCDDTTSQNNSTNSNTTTTACADSDGDGFSIGPDCEESTDCNDGDADVNPDADEVCGDNRDNDCDNDIDEGCEVAGPCVEGATRECGQDMGRCTVGSQTCTDGEWTECDGERAVSETCNGVDDDCDGETDENGIELCDDGLVCNGVSVCEAGACTAPEMLDCSDLDDACTQGMCSEKDRGCRAFPIENGTACDDGLFCTENGSCNAGECVTTPRDCSGEEDACNLGVCDETVDACVKQPKSDGIVCDDGSFCTTADTCTAGVCAGPARDCSSAADQCNTGVCDDTVDACVPSAVNDGTTCEDGQYCTVNDACMAGACVGGGGRQCGAVGGSCRDGVCDEALDMCTGDPVADGTTCEDGQFCTTGDTCVAGNCMGGGPRNCASANGVCRVGTCNESVNQCVPSPAPDGTTCDDGQFCTTGDSCTAGACGGATRNCASASGECTVGACDEAQDACVGQPASDGSACPDSLFCTQNEICLAGTCNRQARDCSGSGDICNVGFCDDSADACVATPKADGTMCTDGLYCTTNDTCQAGACTGGPTSCSQFDDVCSMGTCDEMANSCTGMALPDNTSCDDGEWCTIMDGCSGGVCVGAQRNCAAMSDQCNVGMCDEPTDSCIPDPLPAGTTCNDGDFCTVNDTCTNGVCGGPDRDCSGLTDDCNVGVCTGAGCVPNPRADGTSCTLAAYCIVNTTCSAGNCVGEDRDCSAAVTDPMCQYDSCNENTNSCVAMDNGMCDVCNTGTPTAVANVTSPANGQAVPDQLILFSAAGSSDPTGQTLTYSWQVTQRPVGSVSVLTGTATATPSMRGDVSGDYEVCLTVTDTDACTSDVSCATFTVAPIAKLHIELTWANDRSDIDVHFLAGTDRKLWFDARSNNGSSVTCSRGGPPARNGPDNYWCVQNPDWGGTPELWSGDNNGANDPSLDVDNVTGYGPENINQDAIEDGVYTIGVHYFADIAGSADSAAGDQNARIRVYVNGALEAEYNRTLSCREFWEVARVNVSGNGTNISSSSLNQTFDVMGDANDDVLNVLFSNGTNSGINQAPRGVCRCSSSNQCFGSEICGNSSIGMICGE